jgi:DNA-binding transcriptional MerR regulator
VLVAVIKGDDQAPGIRGEAARRARLGEPASSQSHTGHQGLLFGEEQAQPPEEVGYRGTTACAAAGITYRQLDYWARTGLVEPSVRPASGSGSQRLYGFRDILALKIVKRLLDTGISLQQIRAAVAYLHEQGADDVTQVTLMSDGASVYACTSPDEVVDLLQGGQGVFGIALGRVWQEVEGTLADVPADWAESADADADAAGPVASDELARRRARRTG